jgi:guanylate kinase
MSGVPFVISAPSGTGKTTVCRALVDRDENLHFSTSHTTRARRPGEKHGEDYYFVDEREFEELKERGEFLEWARYGANLYGTSRSSLNGPISEGFDLLLEIEVVGAEQIHDSGVEARFIFLLPPTLQELEKRLRGRATDSDEVIAKRLSRSEFELSKAGLFDYAVVNDDLERAISEVHEIIEAERRGDCEDVHARFGRDVALARWRESAGVSSGAV